MKPSGGHTFVGLRNCGRIIGGASLELCKGCCTSSFGLYMVSSEMYCSHNCLWKHDTTPGNKRT